jgi:hypothetical protein
MELLPHVPEDLFLDELEDDQEAFEREAEMPEADDFTPEQYDEEYLNAEFLLPRMGDVTKARVKARKSDADGNPIGRDVIQNRYWI